MSRCPGRSSKLICAASRSASLPFHVPACALDARTGVAPLSDLPCADPSYRTTALHSHERPPPFDDDEDGEFKGNGNAYRGDPGSWFVSQASRKIDYTDYCKSRYRPGVFPALLTRKDFWSSSLSLWHDSPLPLPHKFAEPHPCSIRFKMSGGAVRKMPWLQLDGQVFELHGTSTKVIKHFLGGRVSLIIEQLQWEGPWSAMMSSATRLRYTELFRKMDVDNSGTVDGGELSFAFEQLGIEIDEATIMQMVSKHSKKHAAEREVTINEFFELMESQSHNGRAWFVISTHALTHTRTQILTRCVCVCVCACSICVLCLCLRPRRRWCLYLCQPMCQFVH